MTRIGGFGNGFYIAAHKAAEEVERLEALRDSKPAYNFIGRARVTAQLQDARKKLKRAQRDAAIIAAANQGIKFRP
jgi:hypothetical protein